MNLIQNIIYRATKRTTFNALILPFNGHYENLLANSNNKIWCVPQLALTKIEEDFSEKIYLIKIESNNLNLPNGILLDCIIVHDRIKQYNIIKSLSINFRIPIILVEHQNILDYPQDLRLSTPSIEVFCNEKNMYNGGGLNLIKYPEVEDFNEKWQNIFMETQSI